MVARNDDASIWGVFFVVVLASVQLLIVRSGSDDN